MKNINVCQKETKNKLTDAEEKNHYLDHMREYWDSDPNKILDLQQSLKMKLYVEHFH